MTTSVATGAKFSTKFSSLGRAVLNLVDLNLARRAGASHLYPGYTNLVFLERFLLRTWINLVPKLGTRRRVMIRIMGIRMKLRVFATLCIF